MKTPKTTKANDTFGNTFIQVPCTKEELVRLQAIAKRYRTTPEQLLVTAMLDLLHSDAKGELDS